MDRAAFTHSRRAVNRRRVLTIAACDALTFELAARMANVVVSELAGAMVATTAIFTAAIEPLVGDFLNHPIDDF